LEYKFYTEFQSHDPEFDCLKSTEIEPKINVIRWWKNHSSNMHLITTNDKTIKMWRLGQKTTRKKRRRLVIPGIIDELRPEEEKTAEEEAAEDIPMTGATQKRSFANAHLYVTLS
jgi:hypothetical protein